MILTNNVVQRILCIRNGDSVGTAFTIDRAVGQYIVTARHVVDGMASACAVSTRHELQTSVVRAARWTGMVVGRWTARSPT
ncbi:hypothetical protein [Candidatus Palauibacter polyketidifaciens]|uniref:hypothetical protein n=1 Tax=Candidatus Palauibacter polyketidifaciens TaxID=3056740 RepID=UPI00239D7EA4|nr:hypothetical protein [Candidatus Palauibacter polyketidifaciens]MDE2721616.1 hypothetical protein [Candidatus Palauibacter polyketidifaciens]